MGLLGGQHRPSADLTSRPLTLRDGRLSTHEEEPHASSSPELPYCDPGGTSPEQPASPSYTGSVESLDTIEDEEDDTPLTGDTKGDELYSPCASSSSDSRPTPATPVETGAEPTATPVPYIKLFPLCMSRMAEGVIYAVILPYINEMIRGLGVEEKMVGVWSATAESAFMITESTTAPLFAPLADKYGRRPLFLLCIFLWGCGAVAFGLVKSVLAAVLCRAFLGLFAGGGVLSRTMAGELCDKTNRIRGFAIFSPSLTVGVTLGPVIGGFLSNPVPTLLPASCTLFASFPYLLPSLVAGMTGFLAWATGYIYLPETMPPSLRSSEVGVDKAQRPSVGRLIRHKPFQSVLILYGLTNAVQFSFEAVYPLFAFTRKELGGLELPTHTIGIVLGLSAGLSILMTIFLFPLLHRLIPQDTYLTLCLLCYPLAIVFFPLLWALHSYTPEDQGLGWHTIALMSVQMVIRRIGDFSLTMLDTIVFDAIPSPSFLVTANSFTFSIGALGRAAGPFVISYLFSLSTHFASTHPARQTVWMGFVLVSLPGVWLGWETHRRGRESARGAGAEVEAGFEERVELMQRDELGRREEGRG